MRFLGFELFLMVMLAPIVIYNLPETGICFFGPSYLTDGRLTTIPELNMANLSRKNLPSRIQGRKQKIPYLFHQTNQKDLMPSDMLMAIDTVRQQNPEYSHLYYNATERRQFIKEHMGPTVLACYDKIIPNAYKADLFRYSVVLIRGGCYADIGFLFVRPLRDALRANDSFLSTPDGIATTTKINSAFFCAEAGHPILSSTLKVAVKHIVDQNYTSNPLGITGPIAFLEGFRLFFNTSIDIEERTAVQFDYGVRLLQQELWWCGTYPILDYKEGPVLMYHKYPRFAIDARVLSNNNHYSFVWNIREAFNQSVVVPADGVYLT